MSSNNFFEKRRISPKERKKELREPKPNSFLIVTEGEKTEPLYFDGLANHVNSKYGKSISVEKPIIDTQGTGKGTTSLVEAAAKYVSRAKIVYSQVWILFDKDDFKDFDSAISLAEKKGYRVAWSNQSFEYWIYLHFNYSDVALHRDAWIKKLDDIFKRIDGNGYKKNDARIFEIATTSGSLKRALTNARKVEGSHNNKLPSQCDPCTKVHHLISELKPWLGELLE